MEQGSGFTPDIGAMVMFRTTETDTTGSEGLLDPQFSGASASKAMAGPGSAASLGSKTGFPMEGPREVVIDSICPYRGYEKEKGIEGHPSRAGKVEGIPFGDGGLPGSVVHPTPHDQPIPASPGRYPEWVPDGPRRTGSCPLAPGWGYGGASHMSYKYVESGLKWLRCFEQSSIGSA